MSTKKINTVIAIVILGLLGSYIYLTSSISAIGYEIKSADQNLLNVKEKQGDLVIELSNSKTADFLIGQGESLGLISVGTLTHFIDARKNSLGRALR